MDKTIDSFAEDIKKEVSERLGSGYVVEVRKVTKNNGVTLTGLTVHRDGEKVAPTVYLDGYFEERRWDAAEEIAAICIRPTPFKGKNAAEKFMEPSFAREHLCYRLVNRKENKELLKDTPYREFLDLAIVYFLSVDVGMDGHGSILVKDNMMRLWGMDEDELYRIAAENTPRIFPAECGSISDVIRGFTGEFSLGEDDVPLRIITNKHKLNGATAVLYEGLLEYEAELAGGDIYVIPSSVHEFLVVKKDIGMKVREIKTMIHEINETILSPDEVLSDSLYTFSERDGLQIAGKE